jgi:hypothetical protein
VAGEHGRWEPLSVPEVAGLFGGAPFPWWVAGGRAIDLFVGRETRRHGDTDLQLLRRDQLAAQEALAGWDLHAADPPGTLRRWMPGEELRPPVNHVWCRRAPGAPWALQLMLAEAEDGRWLFRRDRRITRPIEQFGRRCADGVPYVAPEVQLLFKSRDPQSKDEADFAARPLLDPAARRWLADALSLHAPGHPWLPRPHRSGDG